MKLAHLILGESNDQHIYANDDSKYSLKTGSLHVELIEEIKDDNAKYDDFKNNIQKFI